LQVKPAKECVITS